MKGAYPGSFDPLTVAHLAIAEAARRQAQLDRVDLVLSRDALGKPLAHAPIEERAAAIERAARSRPWLGVVVSDAQLLVDVGRGYDALVMGADKWEQIHELQWYADEDARDAALAALPRVLVVPRPGFATHGAEVLDLDEAITHVSSTRARAGEHHLIAPEARRRIIVDGNNVIGSRPDGWWRDRPGAARKLIAELQERASRTGERIAVVFDGRPLADAPEGVHAGVLVAYAWRAGRNAADDRITDEVEADAHPASLTVVTSDRELSKRVQQLGARVSGPTAFREPERR
jgi:nicotinic acid mononucleotide adenylyltransferase/predicted RNA-binding protein with PIN domain